MRRGCWLCCMVRQRRWLECGGLWQMLMVLGFPGRQVRSEREGRDGSLQMQFILPRSENWQHWVSRMIHGLPNSCMPGVAEDYWHVGAPLCEGSQPCSSASGEQKSGDLKRPQRHWNC